MCLLQGIFIPQVHLFFGVSFLALCLAFLLRFRQKQTPAAGNAFFFISLYGFLFLLAFETATAY
ncbi:MAG: hypothetical protein O9353_02040, partial [Bacteroidia bacterium]|nr:hypothetical protein [Bacteroidia bacterium]